MWVKWRKHRSSGGSSWSVSRVEWQKIAKVLYVLVWCCCEMCLIRKSRLSRMVGGSDMEWLDVKVGDVYRRKRKLCEVSEIWICTKEAIWDHNFHLIQYAFNSIFNSVIHQGNRKGTRLVTGTAEVNEGDTEMLLLLSSEKASPLTSHFSLPLYTLSNGVICCKIYSIHRAHCHLLHVQHSTAQIHR